MRKALQSSSAMQTATLVHADRIYWADLRNGPKQIRTVRVHTGLPKLWLCTELQTLLQTAIPESALGNPKPPTEIGT